MNTTLPLALSALLASSLVGCTELAVETRSEPQPLYATSPTYVQPAPTYVEPGRTYVEPNRTYVAPAPSYDAPRRVVAQPRYESHGRGDLNYSVGLLKNSMADMNGLLRSYGRDNYGRLKDELSSLNAQVDNFQTLVNRGERPSVLRNYFNNVEEAAAALDVHLKNMDADRPVNQAWNNVGAAYHRVSEDINYRSASER